MCDDDQIRQRVSRAYARVVARPVKKVAGAVIQKGYSVKRAGYDPEKLRLLPPDAVANSCGCGNPPAASGIQEGDVVLDLGCGAGIDLLLAHELVGPRGRVIGVDMTEAMLATARQVVADSGVANVEVREGLIEDIPVKNASVDRVISNCVINLSPQKRRVFAEIARVLRPGGRMLVSDIIADDLPAAARNDLRLYECCVGGALTEREYRDGLQAVGLTDIAITKRMEYAASDLRHLMDSDRWASGKDACDGGKRPERADELAAVCAGRVWAASISARKPL
ncbi:MAG: methyltransferase domain-containing protein [Planctomycetota bacterium]|jgi:SAM-dependent methyltransferase